MDSILLISTSNVSYLFKNLKNCTCIFCPTAEAALSALDSSIHCVIIDVELAPIDNLELDSLIDAIQQKDPFVTLLLGIHSSSAYDSMMSKYMQTIPFGISQFIQFSGSVTELSWVLSYAFFQTRLSRQMAPFISDKSHYLSLLKSRKNTACPISKNELNPTQNSKNHPPKIQIDVSKQFTILIVEDEDLIRKHIVALFSSTFSIKEADTAEKALATIRDHSIDLVLLDITLPEKRGIAIVSDIKTLSPKTDIIMITAHGDFTLIESCIRDGAVDYIVKPYSKHYLRQAVKRVIQNKIFTAILEERQPL